METTAEEMREALKAVIDPEIGIDIVTLGLVYDVVIDDGNAIITFTLTTPGCPLQRYITDAITGVAYAQPGISEVTPRVVWEPRWTPERINEANEADEANKTTRGHEYR